MLKAILFDFNGVIADDEILHLELFQKVLLEKGISLSQKDYFEKNYLGMDDHDCFRAVIKAQGRNISDTDLQHLIAKKAAAYQECFQDRMVLFPGAVELVKQCAQHYPLVIVSGALRPEIEAILQHADIRSCFKAIVSAEDVQEGKPCPEGFLLGLKEINKAHDLDSSVQPAECLVIEDSPFGIQGARDAGMRCMAITHSYDADRLQVADLVVSSLQNMSLSSLEQIFEGQGAKASEQAGTILAYCPDLFFTSKITETGRQVGATVRVTSNIDQLREDALHHNPPLILIDLGDNGVDYAQLITGLRQALPKTSLIAYGSHVDTDLRAKAEQAGCNEVLVRSAFVKRLASILEDQKEG